jgi:hypothetical protein
MPKIVVFVFFALLGLGGAFLPSRPMRSMLSKSLLFSVKPLPTEKISGPKSPKKTDESDDEANSLAKEAYSKVSSHVIKTVEEVRSALSTPEAKEKIEGAKSEVSYRLQDAMEKSKHGLEALHESATSPEMKEKAAGLQSDVSEKLHALGQMGKKLLHDAVEKLGEDEPNKKGKH